MKKSIKNNSKRNILGIIKKAAIATVISMSSIAMGAPAVFTGTTGGLAGQVTFDTSGTNLKVTLVNTAPGDTQNAGQVLTAVFFNVAGDPALTKTSANPTAGSAVYLVGTGPQNTSPQDGLSADGVGGEWAYRNDLDSDATVRGDADLTGVNAGISSAGFNVFGPGDRFNAVDLQSPASPNGSEYGLLSAGDNVLTGNGSIGGSNLIKNSVDFVLGGLPGGFDPSVGITNVVFQWGTGLGEDSTPGGGGGGGIPEPASFSLIGGILGVLGLRRNRKAKN